MGCLYKIVALFIPGISKENIEAESITPADIAIIEFIKFLFVFLNKNTIADPKTENKKAILPPKKDKNIGGKLNK